MSSLTINGSVKFTAGGRSLPGVMVQLWDSTGGYGWIASATTDTSGDFVFSLTDDMDGSPGIPIASMIEGHSIIPEYRVYHKGTLLTDQVISDYTDIVHIYIDGSDDSGTTLDITGQVTFTESGLPIAGVKVELWDAGGTYGWIASTNTDISGNFNFIISDSSSSPAVPIASLISDSTITAEYIVYRNGVQLTDQTIADYTDPVNINIDENDFDTSIQDALPDNSVASYIQIQGTVLDTNGQPAEGITVNIYESGFNTKFLLASTAPDHTGYYVANINTRTINNTTVLANRSIRAEATDSDGDTVASSPDVFNWNGGTTINLTTITTNTNAVFDKIVTKISTIIGSDLSVDSFDSMDMTSSVNYISGAIGETTDTINEVINSHITASGTGIDNPDFFYALKTTQGSSDIMNMLEPQIRSAITNAIGSNIIASSFTDDDVDTFVANVKAYQVTQLKATGITNESYTFNDVCNAIFAGQTDIDNFLTTYNTQSYDQVSDFWSAYTDAYGSDLANLAQLGLQLCAITCYQPQTIASIISTLGSDDVSTLATWSLDDWSGIISTNCSTTGILCVPSPIRGTETDPTNTTIQSQYAQRLLTITQNMYPLTGIGGQLQSDTGSGLISDDDLRSQVATFISNNPGFDLRVSSIFDINGDDYDLTGVDDTSSLQSALAPFQRVLRITCGYPDAVGQLITDGLDSAYAISQMSFDDFVDTYSSSFPGNTFESSARIKSRVSGTITAPAMAASVHVAASNIASVTNSSLVSTYTSSLTTSVSYAPAVILQNGQIIHLQIVPPLPTYFPGGYFAESGDDPNLSSLFGNMDYCNCCDCLSIYGPAAYLADTLNFIQTKAGAAYNALIKRRPDLVNIDLTCKNTDTAMPYIDLVNEMLEISILNAENSSLLPLSFTDMSYQTQGTEDALAAYPEHIYKNSDGVYIPDASTGSTTGYSAVYSNYLANAVYPTNLPFNLAIEETRTYLEHLGISRFDLMQLFNPINQSAVSSGTDAPTNSITDYSTYAEFLGLTQFAASIVDGSYSYCSDPYLFYGLQSATLSSDNQIQDPLGGTISTGNYIDVLSNRVDLFIQQAGITYDELLQYLTTDYLNPFISGGSGTRYIGIVADGNADADTCNLSQLYLMYSDTSTPSTSIPDHSSSIANTFFSKFHRFVRLVKTGKLSIYEWDILLRSMSVTSINTGSFQEIGQVLVMADQLKISAHILAFWWYSADTTEYIDYAHLNGCNIDVLPTVYESIFNNKNVINDANNTSLFNDPDSLPVYEGNTAQIAAFCGITENDVIAILGYFNINYLAVTPPSITLNVLSRIYILSRLAKTWKYNIQDLLALFQLSQADVILDNASSSALDYLNNLQAIINTVTAVKSSGFTIGEIAYLTGNSDPQSLYAPDGNTIELFYENLRSDLQKFPPYYGPVPPVTPDPADPDYADQTAALANYNTLLNTIYQHFSKQFSIPSQWVADILGSGSVTSGSITDMLNNTFIQSTYDLSENNITYLDGYVGSVVGYPFSSPPASPPVYDSGMAVPNFALSSLYDWYRYTYKVVYIANKLRMSTTVFEYFYLNPGITSADLSIFYFPSLPIVVDLNYNPVPYLQPWDNPALLFEGVLRLSAWMTVRNKLSLPDQGLIDLINAAYTILPFDAADPAQNYPLTTADTSYETDLNDCFNNWKLAIIQNDTDTWGTMLDDLAGTSISVNPTTHASTPSGMLKMLFSCDIDPADVGGANYSSFAPNNYNNVLQILNIANIVYWSKRTGLSPTSLFNVLCAGLELYDSQKVIVAARGKYDDVAWAKIAKPLRDTIRIKQRDALVAFTRVSSDQLFADLLIDVEMDACMLTSRIKQALCSVQLFIDRVLLGIETNVTSGVIITMQNLFITEWKDWRKWYSVWAGNREIFLYPENWLYPELRDDQSVFFKELITDIQQDEVTDDKIQDAVMNYLLKVDDVAKLEPVGICDQTLQDGTVVTHVISRTYGGSHRYYHRMLQNDIWSPWDLIDISIEGDQVMPMIWNNRLYIFWLSFREQQAPLLLTPFISNTPINNNTESIFLSYTTLSYNNTWFYNGPETIPADNLDTDNKYNYKQLIITLNWAEYKNGAWQNQKKGKEDLVIKVNNFALTGTGHFYEFGVLTSTDNTPAIANFPAYIKDSNIVSSPIYQFLTNNGELSYMDIIRSQIFMTPGISGSDGSLDIKLLFTDPFSTGVQNKTGFYLHGWRFQPSNTYPLGIRDTTTYNSVIPTTIAAPGNTFVQNMKFVEADFAGVQNLVVDNYFTTGTNVYTYLNESTTPISFDCRSTNATILNLQAGNNTYGKFKLTVKSNFSTNPLENEFTFEDNYNIFFARKVVSGLTLADPSIGVGQYNLSLPNILINSTYQNWQQQSSQQHSFATIPSTGPEYQYFFQTFFHPHINDFISIVNQYNLDTLYRPDLNNITVPSLASNTTVNIKPNYQMFEDNMGFSANYQPTGWVDSEYPNNAVDFTYYGAYSSYNWELFYHIPMLIAARLSENQQFEDARKWYHYIFDPTSSTYLDNTTHVASQQYWKFYPFYQIAAQNVQTLNDLLILLQEGGSASVSAQNQLNISNTDPFEPYAVARLRPIAFMKNILMKYIDNLIAWGDMLFAQDTIESINEATQLYILAANLLGPKPVDVPQRAQSGTYAYSQLTVDSLGEASVAIESYMDPNAGFSSMIGHQLVNAITGQVIPTNQHTPTTLPAMFYFCVSPNDTLLGYWDTVADRLFKIRHCMNIEGQVQQLPLFDPPIDPALLVRAAAAGIDINSVLNDIDGASTPNYRFTYMLQKANEFCGDVKGLGSALLSALEKKDAEALALLRSNQEVSIQTAMLQIKQGQLDEANANVDALNASLDTAQARYDYYSSKTYMNAHEQQYIQSLKIGIGLQIAQGIMQQIVASTSLIPQFHGQVISAVGASFGGQQISTSFNATSEALGISAAMNSTNGGMASSMGGYDQRMDEWTYQAQNAQLDMAQINKQLIAANIRVQIAQSEYDVQQQQIDNAQSVNDFMNTKYTNTELYEWMSAQISTTYFQAYQMAYKMAKKAEQCYKNELPLSTLAQQGFIQFGNWDSLRKGLLAGEQLQSSIRNMEASYLDENVRLLELTKHVSLAIWQPEALLDLRSQGYCSFSIPEGLYDLDYPGHYNRMIKSISITIPCVAGPYTTIPCTMAITGSSVRQVTDSMATPTPVNNVSCSSIATSGAQNDSGMFEFSFRDERYLPFENCGAIINTCNIQLCNLSVSTDPSTVVFPFDFNTISDVILHVKYTATDGSNELDLSNGSSTFAETTRASLSADIQNGSIGTPLQRYFSLKHDFANAWFEYNSNVLSGSSSPIFSVDLNIDQFPFFCQGHSVSIANVDFQAALNKTADPGFLIDINDTVNSITVNLTGETLGGTSVSIGSIDSDTSDTLSLSMKNTGSFFDLDSVLDDIYMVVTYEVGS